MPDALPENDKKFLVLLPGGYRPPTAGHYELIKFYNDHPDVERVLILIGPKDRSGITREMSLAVFDLYRINEFENTSIEKTDYDNPMRAAYEFLISDPRRENYAHLTFSIGASDKEDEETGKIDFERAAKFVNYFKNKPEKLPEEFEVGIPPCCPAVGGEIKISASDLRTHIEKEDLKKIKKYIPKIEGVDAEDLLNIVKTVKETATMGGGAVQGHMGKKRKKPDFKFEYIDRRKFIMSLLEEKKIRQLVRRAIIFEEKQRRKKETDEKQIRSLIKRLVLEAKAEEPQYEVTFMNVLKQLLDNTNTMSSIKNQFTSIRTPPKAEEQRQDFRNWLIEYIKNFLSIPEEMIEAAKTEYEKIKIGGEPVPDALQEKIEIEDIDDEEETPVIGPEGAEIPEEVPEEEVEEAPEEKEFESLDMPEEGTEEIEGDDVGKTFANDAFNNIKTNLEKAFNKVIKNKEERENFGKYLIINLLMNLDNFEDELADKAPEAEVAGYEGDRTDEFGSEAEETGLGAEEEEIPELTL